MANCTSDGPKRIDPDMFKKRLVIIQRCGPAFDPNEVSKAHYELDLAGVPRSDPNGRMYSLRERTQYMREWNNELHNWISDLHEEIARLNAQVGDRQ